ncbi:MULTISPECIES: multicopper oxidase family protein [unclassified Thermoactinomyces]|uniref:multicopper oxidase family protein n=1 Tax=unclassified Thermoactinomyces TaxID=2634588 RepID=UPI0018DAF701|nr:MULTISPECIES: multicopper oxidase family protein [unclassified Thermoactinomyces]MBH8597664.1 multicopper oxidase family protein [Thermoactinomyces sp. CICC 10523]MBH8606461.1 multicopper oxidase family protein [Thermoactinomyces sp. CICC 10521]
MKKKGVILLSVFVAVVAIIAIVAAVTVTLSGEKDSANPTPALAVPKVSKDAQGRPLKEFTITAKPANWTLQPGIQVDALTYDGTVPGKTIKVTQGDHVKVQLINQMNEPVTIHWHGYPVPNGMDGVAGLTQAPVAPKHSFTYDFIAKVPGTYFYHSHYNSSTQVDRGLYGAFIVLPKKETVKYDHDYVLILDEWMSSQTKMEMDYASMDMEGMDHSKMNMDHASADMGDMDHSGMHMEGTDHSKMNTDHDEMMKMMYDLYSVNGKTGSAIRPLRVKKGERVRLRFINAGYQTHMLHLQGQNFKIVAEDGNAIPNPAEVKDQLIPVGASERYEISFVADHSFAIDLHDRTKGAKSFLLPVEVEGSQTTVKADHEKNLPVWDLAKYNQDQTKSPVSFRSSYTLHLNTKTENGVQVYTINGKTWPNTDPLPVRAGEQVEVTLINEGKSVHPMHLHGHKFLVLSVNGKPVSGQVYKDTIQVNPGETVVITFKADNPGVWMFHCHDLHHAAMGMMTDVTYQGYKGTDPDKRKQVHE